MGTDQGVPVVDPPTGDPNAARPAELTAPVRGAWSRRSAHGRASVVLTVVAGTLTGMMLLLGIGMWRNDVVIAATPVRATATVLTVSAVSTGIEFVDNTGVSQRPPDGVLYPGGLIVGQQFVVEYAASDPTLARVAGRSAVNGLIMPLLVVAGTWLLIGPLLGVLRWRQQRVPGPAPVRGRRRRRWGVRPARPRR